MAEQLELSDRSKIKMDLITTTVKSRGVLLIQV